MVSDLLFRCYEFLGLYMYNSKFFTFEDVWHVHKNIVIFEVCFEHAMG